MRIVIPVGANWHEEVKKAIRNANEGDVLVVSNKVMKGLVENSIKNAGKTITVEIGSE